MAVADYPVFHRSVNERECARQFFTYIFYIISLTFSFRATCLYFVTKRLAIGHRVKDRNSTLLQAGDLDNTLNFVYTMYLLYRLFY